MQAVCIAQFIRGVKFSVHASYFCRGNMQSNYAILLLMKSPKFYQGTKE